MDTTDTEIQFAENGVCSHCITHQRTMSAFMKSGPEAEAELHSLVETIKKHGRGKDYDCIIGLSGGVDSSYVAYMVKRLGLRPLAVHLDNGWNSTDAVSNIKQLVTRLEIDLHTEVLDWEEFRDLQLSFLKASTPDSEIPTDHAIGALMMKTAARWKTRYVIVGQNLQSEGVLPTSWSTGYHDWRYIRNVQKRFGTVPLRTFPHYSIWEHLYLKRIRRIKNIAILNLLPYNRDEAKVLLQRELGWQDYGGKHHESVYTRFFQAYVLTRKFGFDKRRAHLSNLVSSGCMNREEALREIEADPCPPELLRADKQFALKKLQITEADFDEIMAAPPKTIFDYPSYERSWLYAIGRKIYRHLDGTAEDRLPPLTSRE